MQGRVIGEELPHLQKKCIKPLPPKKQTNKQTNQETNMQLHGLKPEGGLSFLIQKPPPPPPLTTQLKTP